MQIKYCTLFCSHINMFVDIIVKLFHISFWNTFETVGNSLTGLYFMLTKNQYF